MTALRGAWFAQVGTQIRNPGFEGTLGPGWDGRVPGPTDPDDDVTLFGAVGPLGHLRRWEFAAVLDLGDPEVVQDPPVRVWLPRLELKRDEFTGHQMVMWWDPEHGPPAGW